MYFKNKTLIKLLKIILKSEYEYYLKVTPASEF